MKNYECNEWINEWMKMGEWVYGWKWISEFIGENKWIDGWKWKNE